MNSFRALPSILLSAFLGAAACAAPPLESPIPKNHLEMRKTISYDQMAIFLKAVEKPGFITVTEEGRSTQGRSVFLVHLNSGVTKARFKVFFYAQQHGNEVSGKDALLTLVRDIAKHPKLLPEDVDLYLMPMVNPDGAEAHRRMNGAGADLNRDHLQLAQAETRALYRIARLVQPHLAVDSHEFGRDGKEYLAKGWEAWPIITLDTANYPLIPDYLKAAGLETIASAAPVMAKAGHAFRRYTVGGPPPQEEIRPSTPEVDDGRNGMGSLGALSFIIEAGVRHEAAQPQADLGARVDAYRTLYLHLIGNRAWRDRIRKLSERARREPLPPFIATNVFWGNVDGKVSRVKVTELATGRALDIPTPNGMFDLVVKGSVPTPKAYIIEARAASRFIPVLEAQGLTWETLKSPQKLGVERCRLLRIEEPYDELYQRYKDRQIVSREPLTMLEFPVGTLVVSLDQPLARRAVQVLEPCMLYGLYSYPEFQNLAAQDGLLPVHRLP